MNIENTDLGYEINAGEYQIFFGGVGSLLHHLKVAYPDHDFVRLKQIHSDAVVESPDSSQDYLIHGDAHFTTKENLALCVITADCVPLFFINHR